MATRIEVFSVTITNGTAKASPMTVDTSFAQGRVDGIEVKVPPGPSGLMGFQFVYGDAVMIPHDPDSFIITDNESLSWSIEEYPAGSHWSVKGYNTDIHDHTIQVRYLIVDFGTEPGTSQPSVLTPPTLVLASLSSG